jgi:hypothetical protein
VAATVASTTAVESTATSAMETAATAMAAAVLCQAEAGRHEDSRPGKEQHATEREYFAKHGCLLFRCWA